MAHNNASSKITDLHGLQFAMHAAGLGTWDVQLIDEAWTFHLDERCKELLGLPTGAAVIHGQDLSQLIHENARSTFKLVVQKALNPLEDRSYDHVFRLANTRTSWVRFTGKGYFDDFGLPYRFSGVVMDVTSDSLLQRNSALSEILTQTVPSGKAFEESEVKFRGFIEEAPFAIALYTGRELIIEMANEAMIHFWGKNENVIGMRLEDALPELQGQPFLGILRDVFDTGISHHQQDAKADLIVDGVLRSFYFNFTYKPIKNQAGEIYAILNMAMDVTQQVLDRKKIEEAEETLRGAVELAELGTWQINLETGIADYSDRLKTWFGFGGNEMITLETAHIPVLENQRHFIEESLSRAINPAFKSPYDVEYTVVDKITNQERIIRARGKAFFNEEGIAYKVSGTAQDVTEQRKVQLALEQEVQKRTEELQVLNAELKTTNEELFKSNEQLIRSNEELAQFAYVASHDLQEPLRKIQTFSSMLDNQKDIPAECKRAVAKILQSSKRMSLLIQDLLEFSSLLKSETLMRPIELAEVCKAVTNDFELSIDEKNAEVIISPLPIIDAVGLQMNQLFYNLFSNALKFSSTERKPLIRVTSNAINIEEVRQYILLPNLNCQYYQITFSDNGIGFDVKYSEQIFEVFKRLHGRDAYPGSGIGLALCRRIVANHKGYIYAESTPGKGSEFHIILPDQAMVHDEA